MMSDIFNNPSKPFYRFGDIIHLQKIETNRWIDFICTSFSKTGKSIDKKVAEKIATTMKNHSWYVQQLSHYTWNLTQKNAELEDVYIALIELINANTPLYQNEVENMSDTQVNFLKSVINKETQFTSTAVMQKYRLGTPRNVLRNKSVLINKDVIHLNNEIYEFLDPAFEIWFKKQYFNNKIEIL